MSKKLICLISFVFVLSLAGDVRADNIYWTDDTNDHNWFTPANWDLDMLPTSADTVRITMLPGPTVADEGAVANYLYVAIGDYTGALTVDGGTLTVTDRLVVAAGSGSNGTLNMNGGAITIGTNLYLGGGASGLLNMTGGIITIENTFYIAQNATSTGHVNLNGGIITTSGFVMRYKEGAVGTMDVGGGTLIIDGDKVEKVQGYIDNGWITAYGGSGWLQLDYGITNPDKTTLYATGYRLNPFPADGSIVPYTVNQLQWTLPEPNEPGGVVTCDIYFGTDPNVWNNSLIVDEEAVESVAVTLTPDTTYYWAIVLYDTGISTPEGWYAYSPAFTFYAVANLPPIANAGDDVDTWLANGERIVQLDGSASDDGLIEPLSYEWTVTIEPNELNPATFDDATLPNATVTVRVPGSYTLQLAAYDGEFTAADTMRIALYTDSCEHASNQEGYEWLAGDLNRDCKVDFVDFANFAATWLEESHSTE